MYGAAQLLRQVGQMPKKIDSDHSPTRGGCMECSVYRRSYGLLSLRAVRSAVMPNYGNSVISAVVLYDFAWMQ